MLIATLHIKTADMESKHCQSDLPSWVLQKDVCSARHMQAIH